MKFWFRFVFKYQNYLEVGQKDYVLKKIKENFLLFVSECFEDICREVVVSLIPLKLFKIGRWWNKTEEIDLVGIGEKNILFGECKWSNKHIGMNVYNDLVRKSRQVNYNASVSPYYTFFSKSGFSPELLELAKRTENIFLFTPADMIN